MNPKINNKSKKSILTAVTALLYIAVLSPFVFTIYYALPYSDSFMAEAVPDLSIIYLFKRSCERWQTFGGNVFYPIIQSYLSPFARGAERIGNHVAGLFLIGTFLVFIVCFSIFNYVWLTRLFSFKDRRKVLIANILFIALFLFARNYREVFYWTSANFYALSMDYLMLTLSMMMMYYSEEKGDRIWQYVLMIIFGMNGCNQFNHCVTIGATYSLLTFFHLKEKGKKLSFKEILPLLIYVIVGCLTVFAPGNFRRGVKLSKKKSSASLLVFSIKNILYEIQHLSEVSTLVFMLLGVFVAALIVGTYYKKTLKKIWLVLPLEVINILGTAFPVNLGYNGGYILENRICFLLDFHIIMTAAIFLLWLGITISQKMNLKLTGQNLLAIVGIFAAFMYCAVIKDADYRKCEWFNQVEHMGDVRAEYNMWQDVFRQIKDSPDDDVVIVIPREEYVVSGVLQSPDLREDPNWWVNLETMEYFGKESISVRVAE